MTAEKIGVFIVDDHPVTRDGIALLVGQQKTLMVCGQAEGYKETLRLMGASDPDIAIVDLSLKDGSGLALIEEIKRLHPSVRVLVLSMHEASDYAVRAFQSGAEGYVMKTDPPAVLVEAIGRIMEGRIFVSPELQDTILMKLLSPKRGLDDTSPEGRLTERELFVFWCIGSGLSTRQIADKLSLSAKTIQNYREKIKFKLGLGNSIELIQRASEWVRNRPER